jgi:hypothetical protein
VLLMQRKPAVSGQIQQNALFVIEIETRTVYVLRVTVRVRFHRMLFVIEI